MVWMSESSNYQAVDGVQLLLMWKQRRKKLLLNSLVDWQCMISINVIPRDVQEGDSQGISLHTMSLSIYRSCQLSAIYCRFGMLSEVKLGARFPGLVLSPTGVATLSPRDTPFVEANGLGVVDCSWKEVERTPLHKVSTSTNPSLSRIRSHFKDDFIRK